MSKTETMKKETLLPEKSRGRDMSMRKGENIYEQNEKHSNYDMKLKETIEEESF